MNPSVQTTPVRPTISCRELQCELDRGEAWGLLTSLDIHNCDPATIRSKELITQFVAELCDLIEMRRFGPTQVVHFGEDERVAGFSMVQLIETSLISAHFANATNATYLDVFSCKAYEPATVADFAAKFFRGEVRAIHTCVRR